MNQISLKIRQYLENNLEADLNGVSDTEELFTSGLIDSFALIELLSFMESELKCSVDFAELTVDDFDTIEALTKLASK